MRRSQAARGLAVLLVLAACRTGGPPLQRSDDLETSNSSSSAATRSSTPAPAPTTPSPEPELAFELPADALPPEGVISLNVPLELRSRPQSDAETAGVVAAGTRMLLYAGPLLVDGERWYRLHPADDPAGIAGFAILDPGGRQVDLEPPNCPIGTPDLATVVELTGWQRLACFGDRELVLDGYEMVGFGGFQPGTFTPDWLNAPFGFAFVITPAPGTNALFVRVHPGTVDTTRPAPTGDIGTVRLRVTGHFNDPASSTCRITDVPLSQDWENGPMADYEPIGAELGCRERFVVTAFEVLD